MRAAIALCALSVAWTAAAYAAPAPSGRESSMVEVMAQEEVRSMLRDPDSAKFADINSFVVGQGAIIACGKVNAKNGFGGYGGFKRFVSNGGGITAIEGQVDDFATMWKLCR